MNVTGMPSGPEAGPEAEPTIELVRLTTLPLTAVTQLLNEPRNARHMPLGGEFSEESAAHWVRAKDEQWTANGYGPWGIRVDGQVAGWGGFQQEDRGADFALVLLPAYWGLGAEIMRLALDRGFGELGLDRVSIALPYSRGPSRFMARCGFVPAEDVVHDGVPFRQYWLTREAWSRDG